MALILIEKLGTRLSSTGRKVSWAKFYCEDCKTVVERRLGDGLKAKSCGCIIQSEEYKQKMSNIKKGHPVSEKTRQNISEKAKERYKNSENNPMFGKEVTEETKQKIREANIGHIVTEQTKQKIKEARKLQEMKSGDKHWNWQGGKSFEEYPKEFKKIKSFILERDNYTCQNPECGYLSEGLDCHHIDYNKKNNNTKNLITLCDSCHTKTNGKKKRDFYINFYVTLMNERMMQNAI